MNVFDCAIKIEEEAQQYYERLGSEITLPERKHLFSLLAASEEVFRENLIRLKESLPAEKAELGGLEGTACSFQRFLPERALAKGASGLTGFSIKEEEQTIIRFYEELAQWTSSQATHRCLLLLAEEERRHLHLVEHICDFAGEPGPGAFVQGI